MMSSTPVIYLLLNYNFQAISTKLIHFDVSINLLRSIYFPDFSLSRLNKFYHQSSICLKNILYSLHVFTKRHAHRDVYLIQIYTFLLFNVLKREVSNVFLYLWTINYYYFYSYSYSQTSYKKMCLNASNI